MREYLARLVPQEDKGTFDMVALAFHHLPEIDLGFDTKGEKIIVSCHMIVRALAKSLHLEYQDGLFAGIFSHSWLLTPDCKFIIDCYPVGILGGPIMVANCVAHSLYAPSRKISKELLFGSNDFRRSVRKIARELRLLNLP